MIKYNNDINFVRSFRFYEAEKIKLFMWGENGK